MITHPIALPPMGAVAMGQALQLLRFPHPGVKEAAHGDSNMDILNSELLGSAPMDSPLPQLPGSWVPM